MSERDFRVRSRPVSSGLVSFEAEIYKLAFLIIPSFSVSDSELIVLAGLNLRGIMGQLAARKGRFWHARNKWNFNSADHAT